MDEKYDKDIFVILCKDLNLNLFYTTKQMEESWKNKTI